MKIEELNEHMFPAYRVIIKLSSGLTCTFNGSNKIFLKKEEAQERADAITKEFLEDALLNGVSYVVAEYTKEEWRKDLIAKIADNPDAVKRALSCLRNSTLTELLR